MSIGEVFAAVNRMQGDGIIDRYAIGGWPVQFLPATESLGEEALEQAVETDVEGEPTRVFRAEHLAAIALQTGRAKDKARLLQFLEAGALDRGRFIAILARHALIEAWERFKMQFQVDWT